MIGRIGATESQPRTQLHLETTLLVPPQRVFAAFVDAEQLRDWWGPTGFTVADLQLRAVEGSDFEPAEKGARVVLDQGPFKTAARWALHREGWTQTLERLEQYLA